jgi:hypothetical protein
MVNKLAYGLVALVALTALVSVVPGAAADYPVDVEKCTPGPAPERCVRVYSDPANGCVLGVWIHDVGGSPGCWP